MKQQEKRTNPPEEPELRDAPRQSPFFVPSGYFEKLPGSIQRRIDLLPDEAKAAPEGPGFSVPGNYFENLTTAIQNRLERRAASPAASWLRTPECSFAALALLVVLSIGSLNYTRTTRLLPADGATAAITLEEAAEAIDYLDLDAVEIATLLPDASDSLTTEMQEYLIDNDIDITLLEL